MTQYVTIHAYDGCIICKNISENDTTITVEVNDCIIEDIPKDIVTDYV